MKGRKIVFTAPEQVEVQSCEFSLAIEAPTQVLLRNKRSMVSPGTELACLSGRESWFGMPGTPGYIAIGEVMEKGKNVAGVEPGDTVFTWGPHAEYYRIDTGNRWGGICLPVPDGLRLEQVPFTRMATIAMTAIRTSGIELGDVVAVTGMGLVGNLTAQLAQLQGGRVIGIDINRQRLDRARKCGIECVIDSSEPGWQETLRKTSGSGAATLIDATGLSAVIRDALSVVEPYGECILLGSPRGPFETNLTDVLNKIHLPPFVTMKGALEWRLPTFRDEFVKHSITRNSEIVMRLLREKRLVVDPLLTHQVKPEAAPEVYEQLKNDKGNTVGVQFLWDV